MHVVKLRGSSVAEKNKSPWANGACLCRQDPLYKRSKGLAILEEHMELRSALRTDLLPQGGPPLLTFLIFLAVLQKRPLLNVCNVESPEHVLRLSFQASKRSIWWVQVHSLLRVRKLR